ncbi:hypothetical protein [Paenibacillus xylanilyticus]|uniref:Uncharacterized protein n=1 Tax=Paenibacillus xylanilyticus TaxID=248903 RepID=A0A7Y6EUT4_9BACL|nr:hypothetical protein [Paenibacillus xylanilyticus]NUU74695.1 hypothetical protein [Paenibacillus xylanilyticus]
MDIILVVAIVGVLIFLQFGGKTKKKEKKESAKDWFQVQEITTDGLITTPDDRYMYMLEVQPISFALKSPKEQEAIWLAFRETINTIPHPLRFKSESHPYDLESYFQDLKSQAYETNDPMDLEYVDEMQETFFGIVEANKIQDRKYFVFLETDSRYLLDLTTETSIPIINDLLRKNASRKGIEHDIDTVKQELTNSMRIMQSKFSDVGIVTTEMDRQKVLQYLYRTQNREIAGLVSLEEFIGMVNEDGQVPHSFGKSIYTQEDAHA